MTTKDCFYDSLQNSNNSTTKTRFTVCYGRSERANRPFEQIHTPYLRLVWTRSALWGQVWVGGFLWFKQVGCFQCTFPTSQRTSANGIRATVAQVTKSNLSLHNLAGSVEEYSAFRGAVTCNMTGTEHVLGRAPFRLHLSTRPKVIRSCSGDAEKSEVLSATLAKQLNTITSTPADKVSVANQ